MTFVAAEGARKSRYLTFVFVALAVAEFTWALVRLRAVKRDNLAESLQDFWKLVAP
jgi:hypothetical protein